MATVRGYTLPLFIRQTSTNGGVVWAMRNLGQKAIYVRRIMVNVLFDGTTTPSQSQYQLSRFRTATPTAGTAQTVIKRNTSSAASVVTDARFSDLGLTQGGMVIDTPMLSMGAPRTPGACAQYLYDWPAFLTDTTREPMIVPALDGLCLVLGVVAVIGDGIQGLIEWDEAGGAGQQ